MLTLTLYETSHCHLCEEAQALLLPLVEAGVCQVELVDIVDDADLLEQYGTRIPVLHHPWSDQEIGWPFDLPAVTSFLQSLEKKEN